MQETLADRYLKFTSWRIRNMVKVLILEGHRLTGKSTVARYLRNRVNYATLINPTGFPEDKNHGLFKITNYYIAWVEFIEKFKGQDVLFIFDRHMFSEMVYSKLYKQYDFAPYFDILLRKLVQVADVEVIFLELTDEDELKARSKRDKVNFADVAEDLEELAKQRNGYRELGEFVTSMNLPLKITGMSVNGKSSSDIANEIKNNL